MEIGFDAPVAGVVKEVRARKGQQVAAGDVLLVIEPRRRGRARGARRAPRARRRARSARRALRRGAERRARRARSRGGRRAAPSRAPRGDRGGRATRSAACCSATTSNPARAEQLAAFLEAPLPERALARASAASSPRSATSSSVFADVEQLFIRSPRGVGRRASSAPSNNARLRDVRAAHARRRAPASPRTSSSCCSARSRTTASTSLEHARRARARGAAPARLAGRAASCGAGSCSRCSRCVHALARQRRSTSATTARSHDALARIARPARPASRDALADAALEARYVIFERPEHRARGRAHEQAARGWLAAAEAAADRARPRRCSRTWPTRRAPVFDRVGELARATPIRAAARSRSPRTCAGCTRRRAGRARLRAGDGAGALDRLELAGGRIVLGAACEPGRPRARPRERLAAAASARDRARVAGRRRDRAVRADATTTTRRRALAARGARRARRGAAGRPPHALARRAGRPATATSRFVPSASGLARATTRLHGVHPETAARIDLAARDFELERLRAPEDIYCFHGAQPRRCPATSASSCSPTCAGARPTTAARRACTSPAFERAFYEADARAAQHLGSCATRGGACSGTASRCSSRTAVCLDREPGRARSRAGCARDAPPRPREGGGAPAPARPRARPTRPARADRGRVRRPRPAAARARSWRTPRREPLEPRSDYERKVVEARRRRLVYPYEIVRMLTRRDRRARASSRASGALPAGDVRGVRPRRRSARRRARSASRAGRPGENTSADRVRHHRHADREGARGHAARARARPTRRAAWARSRRPSATASSRRSTSPRRCGCRSSGCRSRAARASRWTAAPRTSTRPRAWCAASSRSRRRAASIHVIVHGVNVGAQSYWDALATMLHAHARRADHDAGRVDGAHRAAPRSRRRARSRPRTRSAIGGYERVMGPNGEAQYFAPRPRRRLPHPLRALPLHATSCPGERGRAALDDDATRVDARRRGRSRTRRATATTSRPVGEIFDDATNPGRKRPFAMRARDARGDRPGRRPPRALAQLGRRRDRDRLGRPPRRHPGAPDRHREPEPAARAATARPTGRRRGTAARCSRCRRRRWRARSTRRAATGRR